MAVNYERIGKRIQELQKQKKLSHADLAEQTGSFVFCISYIETGIGHTNPDSVVIKDKLHIETEVSYLTVLGAKRTKKIPVSAICLYRDFNIMRQAVCCVQINCFFCVAQ